jgi:uncharacterized repeat protein (TIGR01451 family)
MSYIENLYPGTYTLYVTDANGDIDSATAVVANAPFVSGVSLSFYSGVVMQVGWPCPQQCNGTIFVHTDGSNATLPITASLGAASSNLSNQVVFDNVSGLWVVNDVCEIDQVEVQFVDANGCPGNSAIMLPIGQGTFLDSVNVMPSCLSQASGKIKFFNSSPSAMINSVSISGPSGNQSLQFGSVPVTADNLLPGTYTIIISRPSMFVCDSTFNVVVPDLGANCGMIEGDVIMDSIYNCAIDLNEPIIAGQIIEITPGNFYTTSDASGHFKSFLPYGTYQFRSVGKLGLDPVCTQSGLTLSATTDTISNVVLGDTIQLHIDASVSIAMGPVRPGFDHYDYIYVTNNSWSDSLNPVVNVTYDPLLTIINSSLPYTVIAINEIQFQLPMIAARRGYGISIGYSTPVGIALGTQLTVTATLSGVANDEISSNNFDNDSRVVTGSFDPNEILVSPRNDPNNYFFMDIDTAMNYTIYFQNTGTDTAFNIVIVDSLDQHLIPATFEMLGSSHPCHYELTGQHTLKFYFDNILLADSNINEPMSHGYVKYKIKPELYMPINPYLISNTAAIYFDFNPAVQTNTVVSTMEVSVGIDEKKSLDFKLQPNPVQNRLELVAKDNVNIESIVIRDISGRVVLNSHHRDKYVDVSSLATGMYTMQIQYVTPTSSDLQTSVVTFAKK